MSWRECLFGIISVFLGIVSLFFYLDGFFESKSYFGLANELVFLLIIALPVIPILGLALALGARSRNEKKTLWATGLIISLVNILCWIYIVFFSVIVD